MNDDYYTGSGGWSRHLKRCRRCGRKLYLKDFAKSRERINAGLCYLCWRK